MKKIWHPYGMPEQLQKIKEKNSKTKKEIKEKIVE